MTNKLKSLLKMTTDVIILYLTQDNLETTDFPEIKIIPYYEKDTENSEVVNIHIKIWNFNHEFLEPLAIKLEKTQIGWEIIKNDESFEISLYY